MKEIVSKSKKTNKEHRQLTREEQLFEHDDEFMFQTYTALILHYLAKGYDFYEADNLAYQESCRYQERNRNQAREEFVEEAVRLAEERQQQ